MNNLWKSGTKKAFYGYIAQLVISLAGGIIISLTTLGSVASSLASGDAPAGAIIMPIIVALLAVAGLVYYVMGVTEMKKAAANTNLAVATSRLFLGAVLSICGQVVAIIPVIGIVGSLLSLAGFIVAWTGYSQIKTNANDANAKFGGTKLSTSALLSVIGAVVAIIPVLGWIAGPILSIIALVFAIQGWKALANSELA